MQFVREGIVEFTEVETLNASYERYYNGASYSTRFNGYLGVRPGNFYESSHLKGYWSSVTLSGIGAMTLNTADGSGGTGYAVGDLFSINGGSLTFYATGEVETANLGTISGSHGGTSWTGTPFTITNITRDSYGTVTVLYTLPTGATVPQVGDTLTVSVPHYTGATDFSGSSFTLLSASATTLTYAQTATDGKGIGPATSVFLHFIGTGYSIGTAVTTTAITPSIGTGLKVDITSLTYMTPMADFYRAYGRTRDWTYHLGPLGLVGKHPSAQTPSVTIDFLTGNIWTQGSVISGSSASALDYAGVINGYGYTKSYDGATGTAEQGIATATVAVGGTGYAVEDYFVVVGGDAGGCAIGKVTGISGGGATGPATSVTILSQGQGYATSTTYATKKSTGAGDNTLTITVSALNTTRALGPTTINLATYNCADIDVGTAYWFRGYDNSSAGWSSGFRGLSLLTAVGNPGHYRGGLLRMQTFSDDNPSVLTRGFSIGADGTIGIELNTPTNITGTPGSDAVNGHMAAGDYYYTVIAKDDTGFTKWDHESAKVTTTGSTGIVAVSWNAVAGASSYNIYRTTAQGTYTTPSLVGTATTNSFTDTLATPTSGAPTAYTPHPFGWAIAFSNVGIRVGDGINLKFGTVTGTQIGTSSTQKLAFWGSTPVVQPSTYTLTYSTTSKTLPLSTQTSAATTSATQTTPWGYASQAQAENVNTQLNAALADITAMKKVIAGLITDLHTLGIVG